MSEKVQAMIDNQEVKVSRKVWKQATRVANDLAMKMIQVSDAVSLSGVPESNGEEELYKTAKKMAGKHGFRVMQVAIWMWRKMLKQNLDDQKRWRGVRILYEPIERFCMDHRITQFKKTDSYKRVKDFDND